MSSLKRQLSQRLLLALLLMLGSGVVLLDMGIRHLTFNFVNARLQHDADNLISALEWQNDQWQLPAERQAAVYQRVHSGHYFVVEAPQQEISSRSLWDIHVKPPLLAAGASMDGILEPGLDSPLLGEVGVPDEQSWHWYASGVVIEDQAITVWVAEDVTAQKQAVHAIRYQALVFVVLALVLLMLWQLTVLQRGFDRLKPIQQQLRQLRFGEALPDTSAPDEIRPLLDEIRRLLQQLEKRVSRSRNALGNLAHDMKRPVQQLQLLAANLPQQAGQEQRQALTRLQQLVERELKRARIVGVSSPGRHFVLADELLPLIQVLERIYPHCQISPHFPADGVLPQDRDDLLELVGNLLDNACKYGNGKVSAEFERVPDGWLIRISDNGSGIERSRREALLQRGVRLDEHQNIEGSGLGLAICQDIVDSYGGHLRLTSSLAGGLAVQICLPDQPAVD